MQLQSELDSIRKSGLQVVGLSYDNVDVLQKFSAASQIQFPLLSDPDSKVLRKLGIVNTAGKEGTAKFNVAHPMTILINKDSSVAGVVPTTVRERPTGQQVLETWRKMEADKSTETTAKKSALDFTVNDIEGESVELAKKYQGKVVVMVNVASKCGLTPQYEKLQALYDERKEDGLVILGFPCNQFGKQEPGSEEEIQSFCQENYGVEFDMFSKIDVNGDDAAPLYKHLTAQKTDPKGAGKVKWNFEKFVIDRDGKVAGRFGPQVDPSGKEFSEFLAKLLKSE